MKTFVINDGVCYRCGKPWSDCTCGVVLKEEPENGEPKMNQPADYSGAAIPGQSFDESDLLPLPAIDWSKPVDDWKPAASDCPDEQSTIYDDDILPLPRLNF